MIIFIQWVGVVMLRPIERPRTFHSTGPVQAALARAGEFTR